MKIEFNFEQSAVIPYRINNKEIEVLLVTSIKKKKWIVPKGYIEFNLTAFESAKKEAYEEAGVIGTNETTELGKLEIDRSIGVCHMKVFSMEVEKYLDDFPEKDLRKRSWFPIDEAIQKVKIEGMDQMIKKLKQILS